MARVAIILGEQFEDSEFRIPFDFLRDHGHEVVIVGVEADQELGGKKGRERIRTQLPVDRVSHEEFDALLIPGGYSPDHLRMNRRMVGFVRDFVISGKPVAAICHAGWMLVESDTAEDRTVTSWPSIRTDLVNAGARWVDREVVEDGNLITSRKPEDLQAFCAALQRQLEGQSPARLLRPGVEPTLPSM